MQIIPNIFFQYARLPSVSKLALIIFPALHGPSASITVRLSGDFGARTDDDSPRSVKRGEAMHGKGQVLIRVTDHAC